MSSPDAAELERFGIDPADTYALERAGVAAYLLERGVPLEEIRATRDFRELAILAWSRIYRVGGDRLTVQEAARRSGLTQEQVERVTRALGFSDLVAGRIGLTEGDLDVLRLIADAARMLGEDEVIHLARVIGSSLARIAEAAAATVRLNYEIPLRSESGSTDFVAQAEMITNDLLPRLVQAMDRVLRYHIVRVSDEAWAVTPEGSAITMELAVGFADMVGFTSRSSDLSPGELADLIDRFEGGVTDTVAALGGRAVKFIGDEVLFTFADLYAACVYSLQLVELAADDAIPDIRVGLAYGDVISRYGDYYGPVLNVASRLVEIAPAGSVLVSADVAKRVGDLFVVEPQPPRAVKGIDEPLEHFRLSS